MQDVGYALDHRLRRSIYNYVIENPGVTFGRIRTMFSIPDGTLRYHLEILKRSENISSRIENGKKCYYGDAMDKSLRLTDSGKIFTCNETQARLISLVNENPGITRKTVQERLRIDKEAAAYNLKRLLDQKVIWKVQRGRTTGYTLITRVAMKKEMLGILTERFLKDEITEDMFLKLKKRLDERFRSVK